MSSTDKDNTFLPPVEVKILMVGDGRIRFNEGTNADKDDYSLTLLIETLQEIPGSIVRFKIETAYRPTTPSPDNRGADYPNFNFVEKSEELKCFDEVWLFGDHIFIIADNPPRMSDEEIAVLFDRMERGKGVFATGDHSDLGGAMNARIPRIRRMRKWFSFSSIMLPLGDGPGRHDTLRPRSDGKYYEVDEGDKIPQDINVALYTEVFSTREYPHPLLCGRGGIIKVLPDHMHEGECCVPPLDLGASMATMPFPNQDFPSGGSINPMPQIVAHSYAPEPHITIRKNGTPGPTRVESPPFVSIAAYDGYLIGKGRVVVDASFHHFVNLNLAELAKGDKSVLNRGIHAYEEIQNYHQNIGIWLAPEDLQGQIFILALWEARWRSRLYFELKNIPLEFILEEHWPIVLKIGAIARKVLDRMMSCCFSLERTIKTINECKTGDMDFNLDVPWSPVQAVDDYILADFNLVDLVNAAIGGAVFVLALKFRKKEDVPDNISVQQLEGYVKLGVKIGIKSYLQSINQSVRNLRALSEKFMNSFVLED